eukprot:7175351-Karenia_brevis.AAC.1
MTMTMTMMMMQAVTASAIVAQWSYLASVGHCSMSNSNKVVRNPSLNALPFTPSINPLQLKPGVG